MKSTTNKIILIFTALFLFASFLLNSIPTASANSGSYTFLPLIMKNKIYDPAYYEELFESIYAAGHNHVWSESDAWTLEQQNDLWMRMEAAVLLEAEKIVDFVTANYLDYSETYIGHTKEEVLANEGLQITLGIVLWGFGSVNQNGMLITGCTETTFDLVTSFPTHEDYKNEILACYDWDIQEAFPYESPDGTDVYYIVKTAFVEYWSY